MSKTILLGYADEAGQSVPKIVIGLDVKPLDQIKIFDDAKERHIFPDGIKRLTRAVIEEPDVAIFIHDDVAKNIAAGDEQRKKDAAENAAAAKKASELPTALSAALKNLRDKAKARNDLMGRLHQARTNLRNHELTSENLRAKGWQAAVNELRKLILGDPEKKVDGLEKQVADSVAEYDKAAAALEALKNPEQSTPEPQTQLVEA